MRFRVGDTVMLTDWIYQSWFEQHKNKTVKILKIYSNGDVQCEPPMGLMSTKYLTHPKAHYLKKYKDTFL